MTSTRKTALIAGAFYLITFISSIPAAFYFLTPILDDPHYILGAGSDTRVLWGCLFDVVNAVAAIGSAVALFPVIKRQNEGLALGFVTSRVMEAAVVMIGVVSLVALIGLKQNLAGADPNTLVITGQSLVEVRNWSFLFGPGLFPAFNGLLLGTLMYQSRLVPRFIPVMGLIGAPLLLGSAVLTVFGVFGQTSAAAVPLALPVAAWELSLGIYMTFKGFRPAPIITATTATTAAAAPESPRHPVPIA